MVEYHVEIALSKYREIKNKMARLEDRLEEISVKKYKMPGSIIKKPEGSSKSATEKLLELMEKEEPLFQAYQEYSYYIEMADVFLSTLPEYDRKLFTDRFIKGHTLEKVAIDNYTSTRSLKRLFKKRIEEYISQT